MTVKKFEFTDEVHLFRPAHVGGVRKPVKARRIRYLRDIVDDDGRLVVAAGTLGGFLQDEQNLSHDDFCCVLHEAAALDDSEILEGTILGDYARTEDSIKVAGLSIIGDKVKLNGMGIVRDIIRPRQVIRPKSTQYYIPLPPRKHQNG